MSSPDKPALDEKILDLIGVRGGDAGFPVSLWRDGETNRVVIRGINEGGYACVDIDFLDVIEWLATPAGIASTDTVRSNFGRP